MPEDQNFIPEEESADLREDLKDEVGGTFSLINFIFQFVGFFASLLQKVIIDFAQIFNNK